jgi:hypothetical protein
VIEVAGKYQRIVRDRGTRSLPPGGKRQRTGAVHNLAGSRGEGPTILVPSLRGARDCLQRWFWKEIKEGGWLDNYLKREKARTPAAIRRVARMMHGFQQNNKSDFRRLAAIPARLYHRWKAEDEHFFEDDNNLRSLKRDNPELAIYVGGRQMPRGSRQKTEGGGRKTEKTAENAKGTENGKFSQKVTKETKKEDEGRGRGRDRTVRDTGTTAVAGQAVSLPAQATT